MKNIVVISPYDGDGKTTLVETVVGHPLQWYPANIQSEQLNGQIMCADVEYGGMQFRIFEMPEFVSYSHLKEGWGTATGINFDKSLTNLVQTADLILEVHDSSRKLVLEDMNDFLEQKTEEGYLEKLIEPRRMVVMTKKDLPCDLITWFESLSEEEKKEYDNREGGNPNFKSYLAGALFDYSLCEGYYLGGFDEEKVFEVSINDTSSIKNFIAGLGNFFSSREMTF